MGRRHLMLTLSDQEAARYQGYLSGPNPSPGPTVEFGLGKITDSALDLD